MKPLLLLALASITFACSQEQASAPEDNADAVPRGEITQYSAPQAAALDDILAQQDDNAKARYPHRRPKETIELFGIEPGMHVAEVLPGGGWYSKILIPYLGEQGSLTGFMYSKEMISALFPEQFQAQLDAFTSTWPNTMAEAGVTGAAVSAGQFDAIPEEMKNTFDRILFIRALHHMNRAEAEGQHLSRALSQSYEILKPGGRVGVVQHEAPENLSDEWALGQNGYVKKSTVIAAFEAAGFKLITDSSLNHNAKDVPTEEDSVWRLPPSMRGADESQKEEMLAVGESHRMTLIFEKPEN